MNWRCSSCVQDQLLGTIEASNAFNVASPGGITPTDKNAKLSPGKLLKAGTRLFKERGDNLMSWITLQTRTGPEEYQVSDLDEVVWWKTENAITAVGYMDVVSGRMTQNDLETCRIKRPEIVHEILLQQASLKPRQHRDQ
jgi:hypothetical protein